MGRSRQLRRNGYPQSEPRPSRNASILAVTGAPVPAETKLEGVNLFPVWEGRSPELERTLFWRSGSGSDKQTAVRRGDWKLIVDGAHAFVFDVSTYLSERNDVAK